MVSTYATHRSSEVKRGVASELHNLILGGQDGLVNVFGLALGVAAGTGSTKATIIAGLAGTFAESISMAAVAYTSTAASNDYYQSEKEREMREINTVPHLERKEVREIYHKKGFRGTLLNNIVKHITSSKKLWLDTMMKDELHMQPERDGPLRSAVIVGVSAFIGSLIPIIPFFLAPIAVAIPYVFIISTIALFCIGAFKARITVGNWFHSGLQMAVIGMIAALAGYGIGAWLGVTL